MVVSLDIGCKGPDVLQPYRALALPKPTHIPSWEGNE